MVNSLRKELLHKIVEGELTGSGPRANDPRGNAFRMPLKYRLSPAPDNTDVLVFMRKKNSKVTLSGFASQAELRELIKYLQSFVV